MREGTPQGTSSVLPEARGSPPLSQCAQVSTVPSSFLRFDKRGPEWIFPNGVLVLAGTHEQ